MFTKFFVLLTFSPFINKGVGQNLADCSLPLVQQCCGGLTAGRSVTAGVLQGYRCSQTCQEGAGEATQQSGDTRLRVCTSAVGKSGNVPWRSRGSCLCVLYLQCNVAYRGIKCLSMVLCSTQFIRWKTIIKGTLSMQMLHRRWIKLQHIHFYI